MKLGIQMDLSGVIQGLAQLSDSQARASINRSLDKAARSTARKAGTLIRDTLNLKGSAKSGTFGGTKLIHVSKAQNAEARITVLAKAVPLSDFTGTRQRKRGLTVKVFKKGKRSVVKGTFIYPGKRGAVSAERVREGEKRVPRGPVRVLFGPGGAQVAARPQVMAQLEDHSRERFAIEIERDVAFRLSKASARSGGDG